jgi:predicted dehydrogenase
VAVADLSEERGRAAAERFGAPKVYRDGLDLIADPEIEAVVLAFPAVGRTELGLAALRAGKHLLTEKPVAMNAEVVRRLIAARGDRVAACCSSRFRFTEPAQAAAEFIATGALGEVRVARLRNLVPGGKPPEKAPPVWRLRRDLNGGGILMNWGCYDLDYLLGLLGWSLRPQTVLAQTWTVPPAFAYSADPSSDAETHVTALVRCAGGEVIVYERSEMTAATGQNAWEITGTGGTLRLAMLPGKGVSLLFDEAVTGQGVVTRTVWAGDADGSVTSRGPVDDLAGAIREGRPPKTPLEQALTVQAISDAVYRSAETGQAVAVETGLVAV